MSAPFLPLVLTPADRVLVGRLATWLNEPQHDLPPGVPVPEAQKPLVENIDRAYEKATEVLAMVRRAGWAPKGEGG